MIDNKDAFGIWWVSNLLAITNYTLNPSTTYVTCITPHSSNNRKLETRENPHQWVTISLQQAVASIHSFFWQHSPLGVYRWLHYLEKYLQNDQIKGL